MSDSFTTDIVGSSFTPNYPENILRLENGQKLVLIPEPGNEYDENAVRVVAVYEDGEHVIFEELGYVSARTAEVLADWRNMQNIDRPVCVVEQLQDYGDDYNPKAIIRIFRQDSSDRSGERQRRGSSGVTHERIPTHDEALERLRDGLDGALADFQEAIVTAVREVLNDR